MKPLLRWSLPVLGALVSVGLSSCGGGGGGGGPNATGGAALVRGVVVTNDGSTANLAGIQLKLLPSGHLATTDAQGRFNFGSVPLGTLGVRVMGGTPATVQAAAGTAAAGVAAHEDEDEDEGQQGDADGDDQDVGDDDSDFDVGHEGIVEIRLVLQNGEILEIQISQEDGLLSAELILERATTSDDPDVTGFAKLEIMDDSKTLEIEAQMLDPGRSVTAFAIRGTTETSLGARTADANGDAIWTFTNATLPFGSLRLRDLVGTRLEIRDTTAGTVLLFGEVPAMPPLVGHDDDEERGEVRLTPEGGVAGTATVEIQRRDEDEDDEHDVTQTLEVEVDDLALADGTDLTVMLENPAGSGTLETIGHIVVQGGEGELTLDPLPFGATSVADLVGRRIEIHQTSPDTLLFSGTLPLLVSEEDD